jgi:TrwC relaxase/AAA domain
MEGNAAALEYLQEEAGQTRAGYHPGGRWEDARQWVIASFRQHTSRDGDPHLHVHNLILHKVRRESDGAWRALDSMSLYRHRPAASTIATLAMENALTRQFGVRWVPRKDGHGREIADVSQALMDMFSSRRQSIGLMTACLAREFEAQFGRAPDARALTSLRQWANHATRRGKDAEPLDLAALVRRWAAQASASDAGALEPLAPAVMRERMPEPGGAPEHESGHGAAPGEALTELGAQRVMHEAVAAVQAAQPTWTEADLIRHLGERLPAQVGAMSAADAAALLPELARRALATQAVMLSAPEWPRVPDCLRRACGESVYVPHGARRYATRAQLALEDRLLADAREPGAPRLDPAMAARLLGADQARLAAHLQAHNTDPGAVTESTGSGLRLDQAAAAFWVLTSARRAQVLAGPAGSGKTRTVAAMARVWRAAGMGEVIGLATSQTAANVLAEAGVTRAYNTARFLGHLDGHREARGPLPVAPGSLLILDEASMMSLADVAAILALARERRCKVVVTGDHEQLAAVEGGGAMMLLARRQGWVQLARAATVHPCLGAGGDAAAARRGRDRAGRLPGAWAAARRHPRRGSRTGLPRVAGGLPPRQGHPADRPHRRPGPGTVPPRPRRPDPLRPRRPRPRHPAGRGRAGQRGGPGYGPAQHPHHPGRRGRPRAHQPGRPADPRHRRSRRPGAGAPVRGPQRRQQA